MSAPRKPPGPPPTLPPGRPPTGPITEVRGLGEVKAAAPIAPNANINPAMVKPPPTAPPPRSLIQTIQRPPIESIKEITLPRGPAPRPDFNTNNNTPTGPPPRGPPPKGIPPPRSLAAEFQKSITIPEAGADSKTNDPNPTQPAARKAGAISMFDETPPPTQEPAEKKTKIDTPSKLPPGVKPGPPAQNPMMDPTSPMIRAPRPLPPKLQPPGIPEGANLPPSEKPPKDGPPPPSVKPVPDRHRAPPRDDPNEKKIGAGSAPAAPDDEAPFKKGKKIKVEEKVYVKRREREFPEFEESSSDEEMDKVLNEPKRTFVPQPEKPPLINPKDIESGKLQREKEEREKAELAKIEAKRAAEAAAKQAALDAKKGVPAPAAVSKKGPLAVEEAKEKAVESVKQEAVSMKEESVKKEVSVKKEESVKKEVSVKKEEEDEKFDPFESTKQSETPYREEDDEDELDSVAEKQEQPVGVPPEMAMKENQTTAFVPPPPSAYEVYVDNSEITKILPRGRFSIKVKEATDIRKRDDTSKAPKTDVFIRIKLGIAERHPYKSTKVKRKQGLNPKFDNEIISFDITDPGQFVFKEDMQIVIEVMSKGTYKDELIGSVNLSIIRMLKSPFIAYDERIPIFLEGSSKASKSKVSCEFIFEEARTGVVQITLFEAKGLRYLDPMGTQNPYVMCTLGEFYKKKSKVNTDSPTDPYFAEEEVLIWADQVNWVNDLKVFLLDEALGEDKPIGHTHMSLLPYMNVRPENAQTDVYDLFYQVPVDPDDDRAGMKDIAYGEVTLRVRFYPAGKLTVHIDKAKGLLFPEGYIGDLARMDPFVNMTLEGKAVKQIKRTPADKDGGGDPTWVYDVFFEVVDQYLLLVEVMNQDPTGPGTLLGTVQLSLLTVFRNGDTSAWFTLKQRKQNGGVREAGDVFVRLTFSGPTGYAYPQFRPEVDSFDDTIRTEPKARLEIDDDAKIKDPIATIPEANEPKYVEPPKVEGVQLPPPEFTDDEIVAAFKFIDLDHNNYVGASEIRHILVCMGELVTDEEIDMMISMVDLDGDGQVSFTEFKTLVLHPNPGMVDIITKVGMVKEEANQEEKNMLTGKVKGQDLSAFQRQKEIIQREAKKKMLVTFCYDNEVTFVSIQAAYREFLALPKERRIGGRIKFEEFVKCLAIDPIQEYRNLHALFDSEELGDLDFREFLFSAMNFIAVDKEQRMRFSFKMMDEMQSGYISLKEVEEILRGNHMISLASVSRKAETIMRQALAVKAGSISENEFVVVSKKFPNIMMPSIFGASKNQG